MRKTKKARKSRKRRVRKNALAWIVNPGKLGKRKRRRRGKAASMARKRKKARRSHKRRHNPTMLAALANPRKRRRRKRSKARRHHRRHRRNPIANFAALANPRRRHKHRKHHARRRRNPDGSLMSILKEPIGFFKDHALGAVAASAIDLFIGDPLAARLSPMLQGPAKMIAYPMLAALGKRFLHGGMASKILDGVAIGGFYFGAKDTMARVLNMPQAAVKDLADAYGNQIGYLANAQGGMGYLAPAQPNMSGFGDLTAGREMPDVAY